MIVLLERLQKIAPISTWALFGAGIALSWMLVGMVVLLAYGGWGRATEHQRLDYLGLIAILLALDLMAVVASLARARVAVKGPGGFSADVEGGTSTPIITTTTEVKPP